MGRKLPKDIVSVIISLLRTDTPVKEIKRVTKASHYTIYRMRLNLDLFGGPYPPPSVITGRPKLLTVAQENVRLL